jgi:hypothetical protein
VVACSHTGTNLLVCNSTLLSGLKNSCKKYLKHKFVLLTGQVPTFLAKINNGKILFSHGAEYEKVLFPDMLRPEDGGSKHVPNVGQFLPDYTLQHPKGSHLRKHCYYYY